MRRAFFGAMTCVAAAWCVAPPAASAQEIPPPPPPLPEHTTTDAPRARQVRAAIARRVDGGLLEECHGKAKARDPKARGSVTLTHTVDAAGKLASIDLTEDTVGSGAGVCLMEQLVGWKTGVASASGLELRTTHTFGAPGRAMPSTGQEPPSSVVRVVRSSARGKVDAASVSRALKTKGRAFQKCYSSALKKDPRIAGRVTVVFTIGTDGKVSTSRASTDTVGFGVGQCVADVIAEIAFGVPRGGAATIKKSFVFSTETRENPRAGAYIKRRAKLFEDCYASELKRDPEAAGVVELSYAIQENGLPYKVLIVKDTVGAKVGSCVEGVFKQIQFDRSMASGARYVERFVFESQGQRDLRSEQTAEAVFLAPCVLFHSWNSCTKSFGEAPEPVGASVRVKQPARARSDGPPKPQAVSVRGAKLDPTLVSRTLEANGQAFQWCYNQYLKKNRKASGKVVVVFTIGVDGGVTYMSVSMDSVGGGVGRCVADTIGDVRFPPSEEPVTIKKSFVFDT
jgi:outer membrane biosynthesis protein TonB